jgi:hypothetical protein
MGTLNKNGGNKPHFLYSLLCFAGNITNLFDTFHRPELDVQRLNYDITTLLPNVGSDKITQYGPICLLR